MRLESIEVTGAPPIQRFEVSNLAEVVVVAGPNGVGKTRLLQHMIQLLRGQGHPVGVSRVVVRATCREESLAWGKDILDLSDSTDLPLYRHTVQLNRKRRKWRSSVIQFESDRTLTNIQPFQFAWNVTDPSDEDVGWETGFRGWGNRWQDTLHSMFRMIEAQKQGIASRAIQLQRSGETSMGLEFKDPMEPFKSVFHQLLAPLELVDPSAQRQVLEFATADGQIFNTAELSSGEREVLHIAFDFLLREPSDSVVFFDEPELHLHPELSHRLIQTLQSIGERNQFVLSTHSPEVIASALDQSVVFLAPARASEDGTQANQAIPVSEEDETNQALRLLGHSIGIVSLGKKIVLIEGEHSSLDKETYSALIRARHPELVLVPSGGRHVLESFDTLQDAVLSRTIWGVEFFMLCDRDSVPPNAPEQTNPSSRLRKLPRYHLENYFLQEDVLARAFRHLEGGPSWLTDPKTIRARLREFAREHVSYATALYVSQTIRRRCGNVDIMPKSCHGISVGELIGLLGGRAAEEVARLGLALTQESVAQLVETYFRDLTVSIESDDEAWQRLIPGRPLLARFCESAQLSQRRVKFLFLSSASTAEPNPFQDVISIFDDFAAT